MPAVPRQVDSPLLGSEQQCVGEVLSGAPSRGLEHVLQDIKQTGQYSFLTRLLEKMEDRL